MRTRKQTNAVYGPIIVGVVLAIVTTILFSALTAVLIDNETVAIDSIAYITFAIWIVASSLCAFFAGHTAEGNWLLRSGIATAIYYLVLISVGILVFDGIEGNVIYGIIACAIGYVLTVFIISKKGRRTKTRKIRSFKMR